MAEKNENPRKPAPLGILVCVALVILGLAFILGTFGPYGILPGPEAEEPPETSPMRQFIPDSEFPEDKAPDKPAEEDESL